MGNLLKCILYFRLPAWCEPYSGVATRMKGDTLYVNRVDRKSPAWEAGIRSGDIILSVNGEKADQQTLKKAQDADGPCDCRC